MKIILPCDETDQELYIGLNTEELSKILEGKELKSERVKIKLHDLTSLIKGKISGEYPNFHYSVKVGEKVVQRILELSPVEDFIYSYNRVGERCFGSHKCFFYHLI